MIHNIIASNIYKCFFIAYKYLQFIWMQICYDCLYIYLQTVNEYSKNKLVAKTPPIDLSNISKSSIDNYFSNGGKSVEYDDVLEFYLGMLFILY